MWNKPTNKATDDDMKVGAVDTICSLREPRKYLGGQHNWDEVWKICLTNEPHKLKWLKKLLPIIKNIQPPSIESE